MSHIVITGGAGFVGGHLIPYLLTRGDHRITVIDRNSPSPPDARVAFVAADIASGVEWIPNAPVDVVYHLAATAREPGFAAEQYFRDNVEGTVRLAEWASRHDIRNIVFTSTMMVYGAREERVTESSETRPDTDYGRSKLEAEGVLGRWQRAAPGHRLRIVRSGVIFGRHERNNFTKLHRALRRRTFVYVGRDSTVKSCLYVKDFVRLLDVLSSDAGPHGIYNAAYPQATTIRQVCEAMCAAYGWRRHIATVPYPLARLAAVPFEALDALGVTATGIHRRRIEKLYTSTHIAADRMGGLGFQPEFELRRAFEDWRQECGGGPLQ